MAVYLPQTATWSVLAPGLAPGFTVQFGIPGAGNSIPVPGDYDGSGKTEVAAYLPGLNTFAYRPADGAADVSFTVGFAGSGPIVPVTQVVPSTLLPTGSGTADAIEPAGVTGEADELDFVMPLASSKKTRPGDLPTT